ncbi:hypothetical protein BOTBODRAFT_35137 [Botryobasidium botryosum FD-172 SS1]|uniref:Methyltransferase domain-containing protein n=1 Tax=Botryobasidium botryosum (strain FD-172 SS1) TaxID=930990 RepID=A0A067MJF5_BOTB1|nr:hypothetical protein BOTBODRAFT_35137 [Botryobasidium botryosum FD-172 SS1]
MAGSNQSLSHSLRRIMNNDADDEPPTRPSPSHQPSPAPRTPSPAGSASSTSTVNSEREDEFFRTVHGRRLNSMNMSYMLPADKSEIERLELEHRMIKFVLGGKNYIGPVAEVLAPRNGERRVLDCGTGSGLWAIEMADEFEGVQVIGADLAPLQPREVPPNCTFELFDLDGQRLPYPDDWFDVVHARSVYMGIRQYQRFLHEIARVLRPGGVIILAEVDSAPMVEGKRPILPGPRGGAPGWHMFWDTYRRALTSRDIDITIPTRLRTCLRECAAFENIVAKEALIPIGFWPRDNLTLTIGQLAWMSHDNFLLALRPMFRSSGLSEAMVKKIIEDAQHDLYEPPVRLSCCWHILHAQKAARPRK